MTASGVDRALGRVAMVLRGIGAAWMALLVATFWWADQLTRPVVAVGFAALGAAWAAVAWRSGVISRASGSSPLVLAVDLAVTTLIIVGPGLLGEQGGFWGGYPFATLVVALAAAGSRGAYLAAAVLTTATLAAVGVVGSPASPVAVSNVLFYGLGTVALTAGLEMLRRGERRAVAAETELATERERTTTATHLHDSVLQTLALIQRQADNAPAVRQLAQRQERELRDWLFGRGRSGGQPEGLATMLAVAAEEVRSDYDARIGLVVSAGAGDLVVTGDVRALVAAAKEAMVNAAKHADTGSADVFVEFAGGEVVVFIRDRGPGFDPESVPEDRQGITGSVIGRMEAVGGRAEIRSSPGAGTEVRLRLPVPN